MEFEKGQILIIPMTAEGYPRQNRYFLVQSVHDILPIVTGYMVSSIGTGGGRKTQRPTNIPLMPSMENNLSQPAIACMDTEYALDRRTTAHVIGHLRTPEQEIMDGYDKLLHNNGLVRKAGLADLDETLGDQYTVLNAVADNEAMRVSQLLRRYDGQDDSLMQLPLLHCAARHEAVESAKVVLQYGAFVDTMDKAAKTPLWYAVERNNTKVAKILLDAGANMNLRVGGRSIKEAVRSVKMQKVIDGRNQKSADTRGRAI